MVRLRASATAIGLIAGALLPSWAAAQRRGVAEPSEVLEVRLEHAARLGGVVLTAQMYRVTIGDAGLALAYADTMIPVATLAATQSTSDTSVTPATATVTTHGDTVTLVVRHLDQVYTVTGREVAGPAPENPDVTLASKQVDVSLPASPAAQSDADVARRALGLYVHALAHCTDKAQKLHWKTDNPHFIRCVCPLVARWRMPRVRHAVRLDHFLIEHRMGLSFTVTPEGKTKDCRVWVGRQPPPPPKATAAVAPQRPAPPTASAPPPSAK